MRKLLEGLHHFQRNVFSTHQRLFERLAKGQQPLALFITCSDSRINPNLITHTEPGELFILRNAGNLVPAYGAVHGGEAGTIEYAVSVLKVKDIIVCGHTHCGAMDGLLHPEKVAHLPAVRTWLLHAEATRRIITENYQDATDDELKLLTIEEHVLIQLENLRTHPSVAAALAREQLTLHAWIYEFESGEMLSYDAEKQQYDSLRLQVVDRDSLPGEMPSI